MSITVFRRECGLLLRRVKTSVASGKTSYVCHADFLPFPRNADTVSHPWKHERKGVQLQEFPDLLKYYVLEAIGSLYSYQNLSIIFSNPNCWNVATAKTTTSVCMQHIVTSLQPFATVCWTWRSILEFYAHVIMRRQTRECYFMSNIQLQLAVKRWLSVAYTQMW